MSAGAAFGAPARGDSTLWVTSYLDRKRRTYVVVLAPGQDLNLLAKDQIRELTGAGAAQWVRVILDAVATAEHDAAILRQMRSRALPDRATGELLAHLRADRGDRHHLPATAGYAVRSGVSPTAEGFLTLLLDDEPIGQWSIEQAVGHARHVQEAVATADLDGAYFRALVDFLGLDENVAGNVVSDLAGHRAPVAKAKRRRR